MARFRRTKQRYRPKVVKAESPPTPVTIKAGPTRKTIHRQIEEHMNHKGVVARVEEAHIILPEHRIAIQILMPGESFFEHLHARHVLRNCGFATVAVRSRHWPSGWRRQVLYLDHKLTRIQF